MGEFARRVAFAAVAIPAVGAVVWLGGLALAVLLGIIAGLAAWEFFRIAEVRGVNGFKPAGVLLAVAVPIVVHTNFVGATMIPVDAAVLAVLAIFAAAVWRRVNDKPLSAVAATVFAVVYTGGMLSYGYELRYHRFVIDAAAGTALVGLPGRGVAWGWPSRRRGCTPPMCCIHPRISHCRCHAWSRSRSSLASWRKSAISRSRCSSARPA
jgi:CDP-diglyceride synthetase